MKKVCIVDYGMGNLFSIQKKVIEINANCIISNKKNDLLNSDKIILPGVGRFDKAMDNLKQNNLIDVLNICAKMNNKHILGICLGMQLMTKASEEGNQKGLGWFDCKVEKIKINDTSNFKRPHIGWSEINFPKKTKLFSCIPEQSEFYFVHNYAIFKCLDNEKLCLSKNESVFISGLKKNNNFGVQFHPEKSHYVGKQFLKNFINL